MPEDVKGKLAQDGRIVRGMIDADTRLIFAENHIQHPMQTVFDHLTIAGSLQQVLGIQAADVVRGLDWGLVRQSSLALQLPKRLQIRPTLAGADALKCQRVADGPATMDCNRAMLRVERPSVAV